MNPLLPLPACLILGSLLAAGCTKYEGAAEAARPAGDRMLESPGSVLLVDSRRDGFRTWGGYIEGEKSAASLRRFALPDGRSGFEITAKGAEGAGIQVPVRTLRGAIQLEYRVIESRSVGENISVVAIPMQDYEPGLLIEVGASKPRDPRNAFSPYRATTLIPRADYGDGAWHRLGFLFDFRTTFTAAYAMVALRINEGSRSPAAATVQFREVRVYGVDELSRSNPQNQNKTKEQNHE